MFSHGLWVLLKRSNLKPLIGPGASNRGTTLQHNCFYYQFSGDGEITELGGILVFAGLVQPGASWLRHQRSQIVFPHHAFGHGLAKLPASLPWLVCWEKRGRGGGKTFALAGTPRILDEETERGFGNPWGPRRILKRGARSL